MVIEGLKQISRCATFVVFIQAWFNLKQLLTVSDTLPGSSS